MPKKNTIGQNLSEFVVKIISSWTFVAIYSLSMFLWMILHILGILNIDSPDFIKWNLFLSYFAGIQASIVLMSTERQSRIDRGRLYKHYQMDKETNEQIDATNLQLKEVLAQLKELEELIEEDEDDKEVNSDNNEEKQTVNAMGSKTRQGENQ